MTKFDCITEVQNSKVAALANQTKAKNISICSTALLMKTTDLTAEIQIKPNYFNFFFLSLTSIEIT